MTKKKQQRVRLDTMIAACEFHLSYRAVLSSLQLSDFRALVDKQLDYLLDHHHLYSDAGIECEQYKRAIQPAGRIIKEL